MLTELREQVHQAGVGIDQIRLLQPVGKHYLSSGVQRLDIMGTKMLPGAQHGQGHF